MKTNVRTIQLCYALSTLGVATLAAGCGGLEAPEEPAVGVVASALTQADCAPGTLLNPDSQSCAPVRDRRAELAPGSDKRKPPDLRGLRAAKGGGPGRRPGAGAAAGDPPVPGGFGVGVSYKAGELRAVDNASLYAHMTIYPDGIGNLNSFLFSTSTNRMQKGVEVVAIYLGAATHEIGIFDWSCSAASPCLSEGIPISEPAWIWVRPFRDNACWFSKLDNGNGQQRDSMFYNNSTVRAGGAWRNSVSFWNYCTSTWDLMYLHDYAGVQEDCSVTGCAWWGPILETFFSDEWNRPIPDLGFFNTQLVHDGVTSSFPASETDFGEPGLMWNVCYHPSNATWGAGTGPTCPAASLNFSSSSHASGFATHGGTWGVSSGAYRITTATQNSSVHLNNRAVHGKSMFADYSVSASASVTASSSTSDNFALIFGWQDSSNYYYADFAESNNSSQSGIFRVQGGTQTQLADITSLITPGTTYNVKVEREGNAIRVYRNGSLVASADDATFPFGQTGLGTKNDRATFDNFLLSMVQISEHFEDENTFMIPFEGTWEMLGSGYELTMPLTYTTTHLNNRSLQDWSIYGDFVATTDARAYPTTGAWDDFAVIFGWQDPDNYYFASFNESNNGTTKGIFKVQGGVSTQLADVTSAFTAGTTYKIKVERTGSSIKVYRDGTLQATASDSTFTHGRLGFGSTSSAARFDNLVVY